MKRDLGALSGREHDLAIIGGGIYGAAAAWDAAQRGLRVALLEACDFGSGASWNSLKTIHGGLRHLQRADVAGLRDSARERSALLRIAPRLVRPLPCLVPTYGHGPAGREALGIALLLNEILTRGRNDGVPSEGHIPRGRLLSRGEVLTRVPGIEPAGLTGAALWYDAQAESTERLTLAFVLAAADAGATTANYAQVTGLLRSGERVAGVSVCDGEGGGGFEVRARMVLNAAGPGARRLLAGAGLAHSPVPLLRAINLVLRRPVVREHAVGGRGAGRFLFLAPWRDRAIVGTAYEPAEAGTGAAFAEAFLAEAQRAYPWAGLTRDDVTLVHQGLVPGAGSADGLWMKPLFVDHQRQDGVPGLVTMVGVKYTTARAEAERAIDLVLRRLGSPIVPCRTAVTPLPAARILEGPIGERTRHAVREEMALHLEDAVLRRLDLGTGGPPDAAEVDEVERVMAAELGWDEAKRRAERGFLGRLYGLSGEQAGVR
jgi:glycerol-3-phosphate dehydrogenase